MMMCGKDNIKCRDTQGIAAAAKCTRFLTRLTCLGAIVCAVGSAALAADVSMPVSVPAAGSNNSSSASVSLDSPDASKAMNVYRQMTGFLAAQQTFFVELASTTTVNGNGNDKQTGGLSRVWYRRPDHVVWTTQSDISASAMAIDGQQCTLFLPALSKYMVSAFSGSPDAQVAAMSAPYGLLTMSMFASNPAGSLESVLTGDPILNKDDLILGVLCSHITLPTRAGETELWIAQGPIPMPVKIQTGMKIPASPGQDNAIESRTEVSFRWRVNVELPDSTFQLKLPDTAVKADKLGSPVVIAAIKEKKKSSSKSKSSSSKKESKSSGSTKSHDSSNRHFDLAYDPPPDMNGGVNLPSALGTGSRGNVPSLGGDDNIVAAAIQSSKPDSVSSGASYQPSQERTAPPPPSTSAQSPSIQLQLLNGQTVNLASYRGKKAVVLDFWATWCGPCKQSMPVVSQVAQAYRGRGVEFFAVNMAESASDVQSFVQQQGLSIPVAMDPSGQLATSFGVSGIPHLVIIGKDGTVKGTHTGADSSLQQSLMRDLNVALQ